MAGACALWDLHASCMEPAIKANLEEKKNILKKTYIYIFTIVSDGDGLNHRWSLAGGSGGGGGEKPGPEQQKTGLHV